MLLAEWDVILAAGAAAAGTIFGSIIAGLIALLRWRSTDKRQDERTAISYYRRALDEERQDRQREREEERAARQAERDEMRHHIDLHAAQMAEAQEAIALLRDAGKDCEVEQEAQRGIAERQHDQAVRAHACCCRMAAALRKLGADPGDDPDPPAPLPDRPRRGARKDAAEFAAKTALQGAAALGELDARAKESRP